MKEPVLLIGPDVRVLIRDDLPPGMAYLVDAATVLQIDPKTGEMKYPFSVVKAEGLGQ